MKETQLSENTFDKINVSLSNNDYNIYVGENLLENSSEIIGNFLLGSKIIILYDQNVHDKSIILEKSAQRVSKSIIKIRINSGESSKSLKTLNVLIEKILSNGIDRNSKIISLGGGVTGDIAGFIASILLRGVGYIHIPTTLLSQVDSSIGGKTGINSIYGKNLIGSFHQPLAVLSDISSLDSLDKREILSGYAEILKHSIIQDENFFKWLEINALSIINGNQENRKTAILNSCKIKKRIVQEDEFETGKRAFLNLGHTFAHAIESFYKYDGKILHGEAVAVGIILAFKLAIKLKICSSKELMRVSNHIKNIGLPSSLKNLNIQNIDPSIIWQIMKKDKKVNQENVIFILPKRIGEVIVCKNVKPQIVKKLLKEEL